MEGNRLLNAVAASSGESNRADIVQAKRKRMMLAEVYVHKCRKLYVEPQLDDKYEVFHIYEFDENDSNARITPKLSTNCTEPGKIIDVLQNSTGSDTPQLQRLIEKLCTQSKKLTEIQRNEKTATPNDQTNSDDGNKSTSKTNTNIDATPAVSNAQPVAAPTAAQVFTTTSTNAPLIRVKAIESLKRLNSPVAASTAKTMSTTNLSAPQIINSVEVTSSPAVQISTVSVQKPSNGNENRNHSAGSVTANDKTAQPPVKLWNKVIEKNSNDKQLDYLVVSNKNVAANKDKSVFCIKPTKDLIDNTKGNSLLKIDQVYECVSDEFVEDLLVEKKNARSSPPPKTVSPSPLLDTLVSEVQQSITTEKRAKRNEPTPESNLTFAGPSDDSSSDYRCNICLQFNKTFADHKLHMMQLHNCGFVCEKCRDVFRHRSLYDGHLDTTGKCVQRENVSRSFICIVDPPVILMKNSKVFAFRCKHCSLAFHNQRNYVQHAQRHAKLFRCKLCPGAKTMSAHLMEQHLKKH